MVEPVPMPSGLLLFVIAFALASLLVFTLWAVNVLPGKVRGLLAPRDMSTSEEQEAAPDRSAKLVLDQSAPTSLNHQTSAPASGGLEVPEHAPTPDMDAEQTSWEAPRVSPYLNDNEFIVFLATQKLPNGKYRLSANDIVKTVRGDRTEVLAIVRQVREPAPEFRPLTDEQAALRQQLQLDGR